MFEVQPIIDEIRALLTTAYAEQWPLVKNVAEGYLEATGRRLIELSSNLLDGEITVEFATERLKEEPAILKSELVSFAVIVGAAGETLANGVLSIFTKTIGELTEEPNTL